MRTALSSSFLAQVDAPTVDELLRDTHVREVPAGRVFISEAHSLRCGLLLSGLARVFVTRLDGSEVTLRRVGTGAAVGVKAIVGRRNQAGVQAITAVEFLEFDPLRLIDLGRRNAALAMAIAAEIDRRLEDTELELGSQRGSVRQRLAAVLLDLSAEGEPLEVHLSQERLAAMIGASREHTGHELRTMSVLGLVRRERARITLLDPLRLQALARDPGSQRALSIPVG